MTHPERPARDVSVIFPTYNERDNIGPLILEVLKYTPPNTEVIVVDDNSPDGTWQVVEDMQKDLPNLYLLRRIDKRGLASALRDGIAFSRGEVIVWSDCDFSMPPRKDQGPAARRSPQGSDVAVGSRYVKGGGVQIVTGSNDTLLAYLMSVTLNKFIQRVLGREFQRLHERVHRLPPPGAGQDFAPRGLRRIFHRFHLPGPEARLYGRRNPLHVRRAADGRRQDRAEVLGFHPERLEIRLADGQAPLHEDPIEDRP